MLDYSKVDLIGASDFLLNYDFRICYASSDVEIIWPCLREAIYIQSTRTIGPTSFSLSNLFSYNEVSVLRTTDCITTQRNVLLGSMQAAK